MTTALATPRYVWQQPGWPAWAVDMPAITHALSVARLEQGKLLGLLESVGLGGAQEVARDLWVQEAIATSAIEGEKLDLEAVRSSVGHRLGLASAARADRHIDGLIDVMQDATQAHGAPLNDDRLCRWQSALFPGGTSGVRRIAVGRYRDHADPMQIVSGPVGRETLHYTAPPSGRVPAEMHTFLAWFESTRPPAGMPPPLHGLVRAALAHLWFESIHPFEDGNGRIGRALVDMALAQDLGAPTQAFGMARQMLATRVAYYDALNAAQCSRSSSGLDVTPWVAWFVETFTQGCRASQTVVRQAVEKASLRLRAAQCSVNARQTKVLDRLLQAGNSELGGGFLGGMTTDKYSKITGASKPTASRDLIDLLAKGLVRVEGVGRATRYAINIPGWKQTEPDRIDP